MVQILCSYVILPIYALVTQVRLVKSWNLFTHTSWFYGVILMHWYQTDGIKHEANNIQWKSGQGTTYLAPDRKEATKAKSEPGIYYTIVK